MSQMNTAQQYKSGGVALKVTYFVIALIAGGFSIPLIFCPESAFDVVVGVTVLVAGVAVVVEGRS